MNQNNIPPAARSESNESAKQGYRGVSNVKETCYLPEFYKVLQKADRAFSVLDGPEPHFVVKL